MRREAKSWKISTLREKIHQINFPEYQREPNIWGRDAKQRLVDSIGRQFDIASFYFYVNGEAAWDCVDGRQRIGAIMSFLKENPPDNDNGFEYRVMNEIFPENDNPYSELDGEKWSQIEELSKDGNREAQRFQNAFLDYELTVVLLHDSLTPEEFNLQFSRLNIGMIINSGEKLNAMVGELRELCFGDFAEHKFLVSAAIPTRRFATEQLAAQIVAQVFALEAGRQTGEQEFARTRHNDLQGLFKENTKLGADQKKWIERIRGTMDLLADHLEVFPTLRSRAIVLSVILLAYELRIASEAEAHSVSEFVSEFVRSLQWQISKGLDIDPEYHYLVEFQRHLTQASVEKPAVRRRAEMLENAYSCWKNTGELPGDEEYKKAHPGEDPSVLRAN